MSTWNAEPTNRKSLAILCPMVASIDYTQDDMTRTEDLSTKLRTLSYDHERLTSMYKTEKENAANAEREMNLHKSRAT